MVLRIVVAALAGSLALSKRCIRGAAGAEAGRFVGRGHAVLGAVGGYIAAHHYYAKKPAVAWKPTARPQPQR